jgi:hypothetical protein
MKVRETLGWIICLNYGADDRELWWDASGGTSATLFAAQAVRFARESDAETVIRYIQQIHGWDNPRAVQYAQ